MGSNNAPHIPTEMQDLLHHMQRATSLLAERLANTSSSATLGPPAPSSSLPQSIPIQTPSPSPSPSSSYHSSVRHLTPSSLNTAPDNRNSEASHFSRFSPYTIASHNSREDNVQANLSRLFRPYTAPEGGWKGRLHRKKKELPWTHTFVCLPEPDFCTVPNTEETKFFEACGIGKKTIHFQNGKGDHTYLSEHLFNSYPALRQAGGYKLAKSDRSKRLNNIPIPPSGYSLEYLRRHVDIKRAPLYVIPLQRGLTLTAPVVETDAVLESCLSCNKVLPLCDLPDHLKICSNEQDEEEESEKMTESTEGEEDEDLALAIFESLQPSPAVSVSASAGESAVVQHEQFPMISEDGDTEVKHDSELVILLSSEDDAATESETSKPDLTSIFKTINDKLDRGVPPIANSVNLTRDSVLESAFRTFRRNRFSPCHRLNVVFVDVDGATEGAVDDGGPTREFLRLLVVAIKNSIHFSGPDDQKHLALVSRAMERDDYKVLGKMLAVAIVHGGIRPSFFSERLYSRIALRPPPPVTIEEVDDWDLRDKLQRILDAETLPDARGAVMEASGSLGLLGCPGMLHTLEQKSLLVEEAARAYVEGRTQKALEQFVDGLKTLGVGEAIQRYPDILKPLFVGGPAVLEVQEVLDLFRIMLSDPGSNKRRLENQALVFWKDWLLEVDEGTRPVTLGKILIFVSGTDNIPPLGFPDHPTIQFLHPEDGTRRIFPEANTCDVTLRLPLHETYAAFVEHMESGIIQSPTFGFI